jgi:hypothetical protein
VYQLTALIAAHPSHSRGWTVELDSACIDGSDRLVAARASEASRPASVRAGIVA